jgi:hypothetical protein
MISFTLWYKWIISENTGDNFAKGISSLVF